MARRPLSIPEARRAMREALQSLESRGEQTACHNRPVPYTEIRQTVDEAAALCGRGTPDECPVLALCYPLGYTESVYADDMVYGGVPWRRGRPVVSETAYQQRVERERGIA